MNIPCFAVLDRKGRLCWLVGQPLIARQRKELHAFEDQTCRQVVNCTIYIPDQPLSLVEEKVLVSESD